MNRTAVAVELRKTRRARVVPVLAVMVIAVVALSSANLFSDSMRADLSDPSAQPWEQLLLNHVVVAAMTSPVVVAVLASRQVDIEHQGQGWTLARVCGLGPGQLCRAKALVLGAVLTLAVAVQSALVAGAGLLAGVEVAFPAGMWARYTLTLALVNLVVLFLHLWLAARVDNQFVGLGVGLLGAFYAVFALLMPAWVALALPWGHYAAISPLGTGPDGGLAAVTPAYGVLVPYLSAVVVLFAVACRRFDRAEEGPA
ncbi:ABC transporter permease [Nocardiopsis kunsanensis]|uniref:Uncharacterized protein n=1 Tax=Nocardiopsis kunsanensis TaxID=141693 RepID=A0A918X9A7_9ACTN|nr:ABC transporter permease [Nocardiopsis kunsanensis]GHD19286.1 hypothetical protein GCM10007147_10360 [Nocardiopsis kunsanensis]